MASLTSNTMNNNRINCELKLNNKPAVWPSSPLSSRHVGSFPPGGGSFLRRRCRFSPCSGCSPSLRRLRAPLWVWSYSLSASAASSYSSSSVSTTSFSSSSLLLCWQLSNSRWNSPWTHRRSRQKGAESIGDAFRNTSEKRGKQKEKSKCREM